MEAGCECESERKLGASARAGGSVHARANGSWVVRTVVLFDDLKKIEHHESTRHSQNCAA